MPKDIRQRDTAQQRSAAKTEMNLSFSLVFS
jgi:hypothetical protein